MGVSHDFTIHYFSANEAYTGKSWPCNCRLFQVLWMPVSGSATPYWDGIFVKSLLYYKTFRAVARQLAECQLTVCQVAE